MKKFSFLLILAGLYFIGINLANAGLGVYTTCTDGTYAELQNGVIGACSEWEDICYSNYAVRNCTKCDDLGRYALALRGPLDLPNGDRATYNDCEMYFCDNSTNCVSDSSWSNGNTGYQKKTSRSCISNRCQETTSYRCADGYYGSSSNGSSGCSRCPYADGYYGSSSAGSTSQTSCYMPSGRSGSDTTGQFTYAGNSYWCN